jgi:hypothetical protein
MGHNFVIGWAFWSKCKLGVHVRSNDVSIILVNHLCMKTDGVAQEI